jgi:hypothetical protein
LQIAHAVNIPYIKPSFQHNILLRVRRESILCFT